MNMLFEKVYETTVNVSNPINFCTDTERHLLAELRATFEGRCFGGAFVVRVKQVRRRGRCHLATTNTSGRGTIDVQFLAEVAVFSQWDILVGAKIINNQQMVVGLWKAPPPLGESAPAEDAPAPEATVALLDSKAVGTLAVGQMISVRIVGAIHQPRKLACVVGTLLTCDQLAPIYRLRGELEPAARVELAPLLAAIDAELRARAALVRDRKADLWFFEYVLYAYRPKTGKPPPEDQSVPTGGAGSAATWAGPVQLVPLGAGESPVNVLELVRHVLAGDAVSVAGYWARPLSLYRSSPLAARLAALPDNESQHWGAVADGTPRAVFAEFLKNIFDFLAATRVMTARYNTLELINGHLGLWTVMGMAQRPV